MDDILNKSNNVSNTTEDIEEIKKEDTLETDLESVNDGCSEVISSSVDDIDDKTYGTDSIINHDEKSEENFSNETLAVVSTDNASDEKVIDFSQEGNNDGAKPKINIKQKILEGLLVGSIAGAVFIASGSLWLSSTNYASKIKSNSIDAVTTYVSQNTNSTDSSSVIEEAMKSIVSINTKQQVSYQYYGYDSSAETEGAGSGVIIGKSDTELMILTNNHVISDADSIEVSFSDGTSVSGNIKGTSSSDDLAIVAVNITDIPDDTLNAIKIAVIADSDDVQVGDDVIAIGNALGYGQSVTKGIVSALDKSVKSSDSEMTGLIQTDAAINPGNSGGALLNSNGELIGINVAKYSGDTIEGIGFAIPVSSSSDVINDLMNQETKQKVSDDDKGYLQIQVSEVSEEVQALYNMPEGVYVQNVIENGAAEKAGIKKGDVITEFEGATITSYDDLQKQLSYCEKGKDVDLVIKTFENGEWCEKNITVTLGAKM